MRVLGLATCRSVVIGLKTRDLFINPPIPGRPSPISGLKRKGYSSNVLILPANLELVRYWTFSLAPVCFSARQKLFKTARGRTYRILYEIEYGQLRGWTVFRPPYSSPRAKACQAIPATSAACGTSRRAISISCNDVPKMYRQGPESREGIKKGLSGGLP